MFPPQREKTLNPIFRPPPCYPYRGYNRNSYNAYTPESAWSRNKPKIVVGGVIGLCCGTYCCQWTAKKLSDQGNHAFYDIIRRNFINSADNIKEGRWWVMVTSSFAHVNLLHLGINMVVLWGFGNGFVALFGVPAFAGLWLLSAASCSAAQNHWEETRERLRKEMAGHRWDKRPEDLTILGMRISKERALAISGGSGALGPHYGGSAGASGALSGLLGFFLFYMPKMPVQLFFILPMPLWLAQLAFTTGSVYYMANGYSPGIGHAGHMGGTVAGIAYYYGVIRPWLRRTGRF